MMPIWASRKEYQRTGDFTLGKDIRQTTTASFSIKAPFGHLQDCRSLDVGISLDLCPCYLNAEDRQSQDYPRHDNQLPSCHLHDAPCVQNQHERTLKSHRARQYRYDLSRAKGRRDVQSPSRQRVSTCTAVDHAHHDRKSNLLLLGIPATVYEQRHLIPEYQIASPFHRR